MSNMKLSRMTRSQVGAINVLVIPLILVILLLIGAAGFAFWAYGERTDYKDNVDVKIADAVAIAQQKVSTQKDKEFAQKEKYPYHTYTGPSAYGSLVVKYPKTWSAYIATQNNGATPISGYFFPNQVPTITDQNNSFALRVAVVQQPYSAILQQIQIYVQQKKTTAHVYRSPNVPNVIGTRFDGQIGAQKQGSMVVMPYRDKTLELWAEDASFKADFDNIILKNFSFSP
jgi:hypothetical protein